MPETEPLLKNHDDYHSISENTISDNREHSDDIQVISRELKEDKLAKTEEHGVQTVVYGARWYILCILGLSTCMQNVLWGTWATIAESAQFVMGWDTRTLFVVTNFGNIGNILPLLFTAYIAQNKGLRTAMLLCTFTLALAGGLRLITQEPTLGTILISIGQFLSGVAGCISASVPSQMSETWFPLNERTTATTLATIANAGGGAVAFLLGPLTVSQPRNISIIPPNGSIHDTSEFKRIKHEIWQLLMIEFVICGALFLSTLIYFPATPKLPPSVSAGSQRLNFKQGLIAILKQAKMWQVCLACAVPGGIYGNWVGMTFLIFKDIGITQVQAGWFGFLSCSVGAIGTACLGRLASCFQQRLKLFLILLNVAIVAMVYWVICLRNGVFSNPTAMVAVVYAILGILSNTQFALSYEISCENGYPIHEGTIGTFLSLITNVSGMIFLSLELIPGIGITWANWVLFGSFVFGTVLLLLYKENYRRFQIDCLHGEYFSKSIQN